MSAATLSRESPLASERAARSPGGRSRRWLARCATLLVATAICLGLLELCTRWVFDRSGMHFGIEMWKYSRLLKRPSSLPGLGHEHIPNRRAHLMGVDVAINSLGLRDREVAGQKPEGTKRILVLGDSMTLGWGAAVADCYPQRLQRLLNEQPAAQPSVDYQVLNCGVGNYNTVQEVAYFRERGLALEPDLVVLGFFLNDAELRHDPAQHFLARHSYLYVLASSGVDAFLRRSGSLPDWQSHYAELYRDDAAGWRDCRRAIGELVVLCRKQQIPLLVVLIPELHRLGADYPFRAAHQSVTDLVTQQGVRVLDLVAAFDGQEPASLWVSPGDAHPNAKGHQIIAEALAGAVAEELSGS
ncbi:MAG: SGNH/GDSL hydrolase family protein [Pirellulales bacterium]